MGVDTMARSIRPGTAAIGATVGHPADGTLVGADGADLAAETPGSIESTRAWTRRALP